MRVKVLRGFHGAEGNVKRGAVIDVTEGRAQQLVDRRLVELVGGSLKKATTRPLARKGADRPGGQFGTTRSASSSRAAPAPKTKTSSKRGAKPE